MMCRLLVSGPHRSSNPGRVLGHSALTSRLVGKNTRANFPREGDTDMKSVIFIDGPYLFFALRGLQAKVSYSDLM